MEQSNTLADWRILYTNNDSDIRWLWTCSADDAEHAIEQLKDSEDPAEILMVCKEAAFDLLAEREDFVLRNQGRSWVTAQNMSVQLAHIDDQLRIRVFPLGEEDDEPLFSEIVSVMAPDCEPAH